MTLTAEGEFFYHNMNDIMVRIEQTVTQVQQHDFMTNLALGYTNTPFEKRFLPVLLKQLTQEVSHIKLSLHNFNLNSGVDDLLSQRFDLLLTTPDNVAANTKIAFEPILKSGFNVLLPLDSPLATKTMLSISELAASNIIFFNPHQSPPAINRVQMELRQLVPQSKYNVAETANILVTLVKGGQGVGILPSFIIDQNDTELAIVPLDYEITVPYGVAYLKDNNRIALNDIIKLIRRVIVAAKHD